MRVTRVGYIRSKIRGHVLDVGATNATLHKELLANRNASKVFGLDIHSPAEKYPLFVVADAQALPFCDGVFDTMVAGEVIEHLPAPARFLSESCRALCGGGVLLITTPNVMSYLNRLFKTSFHANHVSLMDARTLVRCLRTCGLEVLDFFYLPYRHEATPGVKPCFRYFFWLRRLLHHLLPQGLQENMIALARKRRNGCG